MTLTHRRRFTAALAACALTVALVPAGSARAAAVRAGTDRSGATSFQLADNLGSVACLGASWCMAVGSTGDKPLAQLWNGHTWTALSVAQPGTGADNLSGVSCLSRVSCVAVGGELQPFQMLAEQWNGSSWRVMPVPSAITPAAAVACTSGRRCIAVGTDGQSASAAWDGTTWRALSTPDPGGPSSSLSGVSCPSATDCVAVGQAFTNNTSTQEIADRWNGRGWHAMATPPALQFDYDAGAVSVSCVGTSWCMAVGMYDPPSAMVWTGHGAWQQLTLPTATGELTGVSCVSASWCMAVGHDGTQSIPIAADWNGSAWQWLSPVNPGHPGLANTGLGGVACASADACLAVGQYAISGPATAQARLDETWNGSGWTIPATHGYLVGLADGGVANFHVSWYGSLAGISPSRPTGLAADAATGGYWIASADGGVSNDNAPWCGSQRRSLPAGVTAVAIAADPLTSGYWLLDSDGGIGAFDAPAQGSELGNVPSPPVGLAADPATGGYWILNADGGVSNDNAPWHGSQRHRLPAGVTAVAIAADPVTDGYWILDSNGDVAGFGAPSHGSELGHLTSAPVGITADRVTGGYWIVNASGDVTAFHAPSYGSPSAGAPDAIAGL